MPTPVRLYGKDVTVATVGALTTAGLSSFQEIMVDYSVKTVENNSIKDNWKSPVATVVTATGSLRGALDAKATQTIPRVGTSVTFTFTADGVISYTGTGIITKRSHTAADAQTYDLQVQIVGALAITDPTPD